MTPSPLLPSLYPHTHSPLPPLNSPSPLPPPRVWHSPLHASYASSIPPTIHRHESRPPNPMIHTPVFFSHPLPFPHPLPRSLPIPLLPLPRLPLLPVPPPHYPSPPSLSPPPACLTSTSPPHSLLLQRLPLLPPASHPCSPTLLGFTPNLPPPTDSPRDPSAPLPASSPNRSRPSTPVPLASPSHPSCPFPLPALLQPSACPFSPPPPFCSASCGLSPAPLSPTPCLVSRQIQATRARKLTSPPLSGQPSSFRPPLLTPRFSVCPPAIAAAPRASAVVSLFSLKSPCLSFRRDDY
ncbi:unnamed protein product [Closterium sp. NIES-65]|nr:unnamed protein product [Closterium sp. NIES-65]